MRSAAIAVLTLVLLSSRVRAQDAGIEFFERKIRPILVEHCYECHATTSKKVRGQLLLDSKDGVRKGGVSGPAIHPGDPDKSLLIKAVRYTDPETKMPKNGKLPAAQIADLEAWVKMGAPDPRDKATVAKVAKTWDEIVAERKKWWSLQPVVKPKLPEPKDAAWSDQPIDRFLLAAMEAKGLTPAADADPRTLIRRLSLVITGLPPTGEEVEAFVKAWDTPNAKRRNTLEHLVDRLLASPHFGERWARHWMDIVRYTETHGNEWNYDVHHAWRYRDYLIRAFNDDIPWDVIISEHIAGDLLFKPRMNWKEKFNESVIGTSFYRFGEVNHDDCIDLRSIGYDLADNQIDTLSKAFQAMTIACARCHDHKIDAISMRDYHGLLGILRSSRQVAHTIDAAEVNADILDKMRALKPAIRNELASAWLELLGPAEKGNVLAFLDHTPALEHPATPLRMVSDIERNEKRTFADAWRKVAELYRREHKERTEFNAKNFTRFDSFRGAWPDGWQVGGQGLRGEFSRSGDFAIPSVSPKAISAILPAGVFTHALSERLNGTLRSPNLTAAKKYISFQVQGDRAAAVRLVSNNCQLNYRNFKYLTKPELHWITLPIPKDAESLRVYAELMTKFDNPKFPDQLGSLGGGKDYRIPWEKAASDPRSHFGVTQVVLHDQPAPPKATLTYPVDFFGPGPESRVELARSVSLGFEEAIKKWRDDKANDDDVHWLDALLQSRFPGNRADLTPKLKALLAEYRKLDASLSPPRIVPGLSDSTDRGENFEQPLLLRGDCMKQGEKVPRRYVEVLSPRPITQKGSGRAELSWTIASGYNPLTGRVLVNRVWHHLFGTGIVRTVDDFGHVGELPSHPELLDYLTDDFMFPPGFGRDVRIIRDIPEGEIWGHGVRWSMKRLIRTIVLSRAFRLSHTPTAAMMEADPGNRLLARYPARRMEAEAIRDSLLATSGRLDRTLYGPSISAYREKEYADRRLFQGPLDGNGRRSIYIRVTLMEPPKFLEIFNFPGGKVCQGRRDVTNTPTQALAMLNDPFVHNQADVWAKRMIERKGDTVEKRIDAMFRTALGREPRKAEQERFARFVSQVATANNVAADGILTSAAVWRDVGHAMFNLQEFISIP